MDDLIKRALDRSIERLQNLHPQAGRPAWDYVVREELGATLEAQAAEIVRLREALEPSGNTKAAYIGEFSFYIPLQDDEGEEVLHKVYVPWDITKEIMKAISDRAALQETANEPA